MGPNDANLQWLCRRPGRCREGSIVKFLRHARTIAAAWTVSAMLALVGASVVLAGGGGTPWPK